MGQCCSLPAADDKHVQFDVQSLPVLLLPRACAAPEAWGAPPGRGRSLDQKDPELPAEVDEVRCRLPRP